jgi:hemolysin D
MKRTLPRLIANWVPEGVTERQFLPAALEIVDTPASPTARYTALAICAIFTIGLVWAWFGRVDIIAIAPGKIIASNRTKVVQPLEIATVRAIHVDEGQHVRKGDLLIELDPTFSAAEHDRAVKDLEHARLDIARLQFLLGGGSGDDPFTHIPGADPADLEAARRQTDAQQAAQQAKIAGIDRTLAEKRAEAAGVRSTLAKIEAQLPLARQREEIRQKGAESGYGSQLSYIEAQQQLIDLETERPVEQHKLEEADATIAAAERYREQTQAEYASGLANDLSKAEEQANAATEALTKADAMTEQQSLTAPVDGIVQGLTIHTIGGVVTPAQQLLTVVPSDGGLAVEAIVENRDIGFVKVGQTAAIKVETFPFTRYGLLRGTVTEVSMDSVQGASEGRPAEGAGRSADEPAAVERSARLVYSAHVALPVSQMKIDDRMVDLIPGMAVTVEIKTGRRRVLDYLLSPLGDYLHDSFHER